MKIAHPNNPYRFVQLADDLLFIHEGDGYYDTRFTVQSDQINNLHEQVGVRGGHVGWQLEWFGMDGDKHTHDFGRKLAWEMDTVKDLIKDYPKAFPKAKITCEDGVAQKCY